MASQSQGGQSRREQRQLKERQYVARIDEVDKNARGARTSPPAWRARRRCSRWCLLQVALAKGWQLVPSLRAEGRDVAYAHPMRISACMHEQSMRRMP